MDPREVRRPAARERRRTGDLSVIALYYGYFSAWKPPISCSSSFGQMQRGAVLEHRYGGMPQVVGSPAMLKDSLTVTGRPSNGRSSPRARAWSAPRAAARARSKSGTQTALIPLSPLDTSDRLVGQFRRSHFTSTQSSPKIIGRPKVPFH
jgi:hypothetical protein